MSNKIYTIGREFGSGGKAIGEKLAERLGIKLYDKELLQQAAKDSGFCEEIFENHDEKPTNSFLYSLVMDTYSVSGYSAAPFLDMPLNHKVFLAQFETIKKIAETESCVIVGRCADVILKDYRPLNLFVYADMDAKVERCMKRAPEGEHLTRSKPAPDIFLLAAQKLGTEPAKTMVLEDSYNGVRAGAAGGFVTVMVPDLSPATDEMRRIYTCECASLHEVRRKLECGEL